MNYDEVCEENLKRWQKESEVFANLLLDFSEAKLKRIDITGDRNNHKHEEISNDKNYLLYAYGQWRISTPNLSWYGWQFDVGWFSADLRKIDILFEIDLPKIKKEPLGRVEADETEIEFCPYCGSTCGCK